MNSFSYTNPEKKSTIVFMYFVFYPMLFILAVETFSIILLLISGEEHLFRAIRFTTKVTTIATYPIWIFSSYATEKLKTIKYDEKENVLSVSYYNIFFRLDQKKFHLDNLDYKICLSHMPLTGIDVGVIIITDLSTKRTLMFESGLGFRKKDIEEIAVKLEEIKKPTYSYLHEKRKKIKKYASKSTKI